MPTALASRSRGASDWPSTWADELPPVNGVAFGWRGYSKLSHLDGARARSCVRYRHRGTGGLQVSDHRGGPTSSSGRLPGELLLGAPNLEDGQAPQSCGERFLQGLAGWGVGEAGVIRRLSASRSAKHFASCSIRPTSPSMTSGPSAVQAATYGTSADVEPGFREQDVGDGLDDRLGPGLAEARAGGSRARAQAGGSA
jgi:hypothetical protein